MSGYVFQHPDFGLGNFINLTPAICWLSEQMGERVPVFFSADYVRQCFLDCPFIQILEEKPDYEPLFGSNLVNPNDDKPDGQFVFETLTGKEIEAKYWTYVDRPNPSKELIMLSPYAVFVNGAGNESPDYVARKNPGKDAFLRFFAEYKEAWPALKIIAVGSENDLARNQWFLEVADKCCFGNIREALKIINFASVVISNDTGLAHAAGAMKKNQIVLIKDGPRERIKNPNIYAIYKYL